MRVDGGAEVFVTTKDGVRLQEVSKDGSTYVVAKPGEEFMVQFRIGGLAKHISPNRGINGIKVLLTVDGKDIGCHKVAYAGKALSYSSFEGFVDKVNNTNGGRVWSYSAFKFADVQASSSSATPEGPVNSRKGTLQVTFQPAWTYNIPIPKGQQTYEQDLGTAPPPVKGKKWFMGPSLQATRGSASSRTQPTAVKADPVGRPAATVTLHYETAGTLQLRGILDPNNAHHQQIIDQYLAGPTEPEPSSSLPVKPNVGGHPPRRQQPQPVETVDLTKDDVPQLRVNGRHLQRDEFAVCDMTATCRAPAWEVRKRPKVELD